MRRWRGWRLGGLQRLGYGHRDDFVLPPAVRHLLRCLRTLGRVFRQHRADQVRDVGRHLGPQIVTRGGASMTWPGQDLGSPCRAERRPTVNRREQRASEGIDVRAGCWRPRFRGPVSGAIYSGVPITCRHPSAGYAISFRSPVSPAPKSRILTTPLSVSIRFCGLMSRWTMPLRNACCSTLGGLADALAGVGDQQRPLLATTSPGTGP